MNSPKPTMFKSVVLILIAGTIFESKGRHGSKRSTCVILVDGLSTPGPVVGGRSPRLLSDHPRVHKGAYLSPVPTASLFISSRIFAGSTAENPVKPMPRRDLSLMNAANEINAPSVILPRPESYLEDSNVNKTVEGNNTGGTYSLEAPTLRVETLEKDQVERQQQAGDIIKRKTLKIVDSNDDGINDEDDDGSVDANQKKNDPVCRVVAPSDGKIPCSSVSSLSPASLSLLEKMELIYAARSQKELSKLDYVCPNSEITTPAHTSDIIGERDTTPKEGGEEEAPNVDEEQQLVSVLRRSLEEGGFKLINQNDLDLCAALNAGYLLRLSLLPDVKDLDPCIAAEFYPELFPVKTGEEDEDTGKEKHDAENQQIEAAKKLIFDGRVLVYRRGYSQEITSGQLLLPKLDYLQASLVQRSSTALTKKLRLLEEKIEEVISPTMSKVRLTMKNMFGTALSIEAVAEFTRSKINKTTNDSRGNKTFKLSRYGASSIPGSVNLNDALSPYLLCEICSDQNSIEKDMYDGLDTDLNIGPHAAPLRLLERVSIQNTVDFFSTSGRRNLFENYVKSSILKEPAYEELVVIWRPLRKQKKRRQFKPPKWIYEAAQIFEVEDRLPKKFEPEFGPLPLEIKAFTDVPMANFPAVLPKTKLIFRPADAFVFDLASVISFLAVFGSVRFDSPRLDLIAILSLTFFAIRTFFRYSNKYARYDLLVNKFLTTKISHRGSGALKYIASEASSQRALRAALTRDWLLRDKIELLGALEGEDDTLLKRGSAHFNRIIPGNARVDIDIYKAVQDLADLGLVTVGQDDANIAIEEENDAQDSLQHIWNRVFSD